MINQATLNATPRASRDLDAGLRHHRTRVGYLIAGLAIGLLVTVLTSVILGPFQLDLVRALKAITFPSTDQESAVVWSIRLPRIAVALLVGGALSGVGVAMQAVFRKPLGVHDVTVLSAVATVCET